MVLFRRQFPGIVKIAKPCFFKILATSAMADYKGPYQNFLLQSLVPGYLLSGNRHLPVYSPWFGNFFPNVGKADKKPAPGQSELLPVYQDLAGLPGRVPSGPGGVVWNYS